MQNNTTSTISTVPFDLLTAEQKFLLIAFGLAECASAGLIKPPAKTDLLAMVRKAWEASGASVDVFADPDAISVLLCEPLKNSLRQQN